MTAILEFPKIKKYPRTPQKTRIPYRDPPVKLGGGDTTFGILDGIFWRNFEDISLEFEEIKLLSYNKMEQSA